jgi:3-deoxy-D-manno-octulosonic-acid transferase
LGEFEQAKPVIAELKKRIPAFGIAVSFFSPSGYEPAQRRKQEHVDFITYLPFDTPNNSRRFLELLSPSLAFFVKYDLWANHILEAKKRKVPLFLFSASLREEQIYFKNYGRFFKNTLTSFDHIFTQNIHSQNLLTTLDFHEVSVTGDTRYDRVQEIAASPKLFPELAEFAGNKPVVVVGSAWQEDMDLLVPFINESATFNWIIAPHDIDDVQLEKWRSQLHKPSAKYSKWDKAVKAEVLFIDNIGMLSSLYRFARIAYVGGAFGKGLHNILEPIAYGIPVIFGELKLSKKFPEAAISQDYGCGFSAPDLTALKTIFEQLEDKKQYLQACLASKKLVQDNIGSAKKIMDTVLLKIQQV